MPNTGVKGRIVFAGTSDDGILDLTVQVVDFDPVLSEDVLGTDITKADGHFQITYSPDAYRDWFDRNPDIVVRVYGPGMRLLLETEEFDDVAQPILDIGTRTIHRNNVEGWLVTNATLDPDKADPVFLTQGNQLEWLIDGATIFPKLTEAVKQAQHSVNFMNMMFRVGSVKTNFTFKPGQNFDTVPDGEIVQFERLQDIMLAKASDVLPINLLVWDAMDEQALNFLLDRADTADDVRDFFDGSLVETRAFLATLTLFHAKAIVVDGTNAFVTGSTLSQGYFSDQQHLIHDIRHGGSLMHDVSLRVTGPSVAHVDRTFASLWNGSRANAPLLSPTPQAPTPPGNPPVGVQVLRTLPGGRFKDSVGGNVEIKHGETGVLEAYQRAIALAEEVVYIEDQYFVAPEIVDALLRRMKQKTNLEVILVLNQEPDIPSYPQKQIQYINQMRQGLGADKDRLGVFTLWSCDETKTPFEIMPIYVHSKVGIVDERWATVGTANIDGASLNQLQTGSIIDAVLNDLEDWVYILLFPFIVPIFLLSSPLTIPLLRQVLARPTQHANPRRSKQPPRQVELNLVVYNDVAGQPPTDLVRQLRDALWQEHLGVLPASRPPDGWVKFWEKQADDKLKAIKAKQKHPAKILRWEPKINRREYLEALGVSRKDVRILKNADKYDFEGRKWKFGEDFKD